MKWNNLMLAGLLAGLIMQPIGSMAQEKAPAGTPKEKKEELKPFLLEEVTVTVTGLTVPFMDFPGTAHIVTKQDIEDWHPIYSQQLLERVPGVIALSEEESGLRPSIGIRGLNPIRSRGGVVLLRDGIPFNPAPYADPGAYYNVPIQRIERIEVIKGGSSILYGPNAVGGVVNYITKPPPEKPEFWSRQTGGSNGLWAGEFSFGGTWDNISGLLNYTRRQSDGFRINSDFGTHDVSTKWIWKIGEGSDIGVHFNYYQEPDTRMPKGISPAQFRDSIRKTKTPNDSFESQRFSADITANTQLTKESALRVLLYGNVFQRDFLSEGSGGIRGTRRRFNILGFEPQYTLKHRLFNISNDLIAGFRLSLEREEENRTQSASVRDTKGTTFSRSELGGVGLAWYLQNSFDVTNRLSLIPGVRLEWLRNFRKNTLSNSSLADLQANGPQGGTEGSEMYFQALPGIGITYDLFERTTLHGGVWRSWSLPQFGSGAEAIDKVTGEIRGLDPEIGMTYELGVRSVPLNWLSIDTTLFWLTFEDQIERVGGNFNNFNDSRHRGIEGVFTIDGRGLTESLAGLSTFLNLTLLDAEFTDGPFKGKEPPLAPAVTLSGGIAYKYDLGRSQFISAGLNVLYVGERFSNQENTVKENTTGTKGKLDSYTVADLRVNYHKKDWGLEIFGGVRNLFNEEYKLFRFSGGIIPGRDRTFYAGISKSLNWGR